MENIQDIVKLQREYFASKRTLDLRFRKKMLKRLRRAIKAHEAEIAWALHADLGKSETESYMCEIGLALGEISFHIKNLEKMARPKRKRTPLAAFPARSFTIREPYGCVLIMSPWNYPFLLCMQPLAGAIAAGNCAVIKPSAYSPATSGVIKRIIGEVFEPGLAEVVEGGRAENTELLEQRFDYIFFTGGVKVGKLVMEKASKNLTPVTLELGGKSPCIIDRSCNIKLAARRVAFGKFLNCGQTCVAPDYILIHRAVKDEFIKEFEHQIEVMYSEDPLSARDYGKIINEKHFDRLRGLIDPAKVIYGGNCDVIGNKIAPTIMDGVTEDDAVMQEEIFGPIMPVITVDSMEEAERFIKKREKPLALYVFTNSRKTEKRFIKETSFGGGCVNDTIMHISNEALGFGGVGHSGMGAYHGKKSFETFSHEKSILKTSSRLDVPVRYAPYSRLQGRILRMFLK